MDYATSNLDVVLFTRLDHDPHPPFYYLILHFWIKIFGISEFSLRFPSYLFGVGFLILTFFWVRKNINKKTAIMSTLLIAITPIIIRYQQEVRAYTLLPFLLLLFFILLENWLINGFTKKNRVFIIITGTLLLYTHYFGLIGLAIILFVFIFRVILFHKEIPKKLFFKKLTPIVILIILFYLPWIPVLYNQSQNLTMAW